MDAAPNSGRRWRYLLYSLSALSSVWLFSAAGVLIVAGRDAAVQSDAIVVLGAAQYAGRPSPVLRARLDHAANLWRLGYAPWLIVTGGRGRGDTTSEAAVGRRYLLRQGIPDSAILLEPEGRTTEASVRAVAAMMRERKLERAILVSDPFHMLRLLILGERHGLRCVTSPTRTSPISASPMRVLEYVLAESLKVPYTAARAVLGL
jgi:uncharacterized SAM-binding protein YcdF (DUF218 family)